MNGPGDAPRFLVVTPARNEEGFIERTLAAVTSQTLPPARWVIADDGSQDKTFDIASRFAEKVDYIRPIRVPQDRLGRDDGDRLSWAAEAISFNHGLRAAADVEFDLVAKLDADISFGPDYFEQLASRFERQPRLGIAGGACYQVRRAGLEIESCPPSHVRGATKVYRRECFYDIGGLSEFLGWDTVDELRAQLLGWETRTFADLQVVHHRPTSSVGGVLRGKARLGRGSYFLGYDPVFMLARGVRRMVDRPYVLGGAAMLAGYAGASARRDPRLDDPELTDYLVAQQRARLWHWSLPTSGRDTRRVGERDV